jgi:hypothetical protein
MNCSGVDETVLHVLLGRASDAEASALREHLAACPACAAAAQRTGYVVDLLQARKVLAPSPGFRERLAQRFAAELAAASQARPTFTFGEKVEAQVAWIGLAVRRSVSLRALLVAAALLFTATLYLWTTAGRPASHVLVGSSDVEREPRNVPRDDSPRGATGREAPPEEVAALVPREVVRDVLHDTTVEPDRSRPQPPETRDEPAEPGAASAAAVAVAEPEALERVAIENRHALLRYRFRERFQAPDRAVLPTLRYLVDVQEDDGSFDPGRTGGVAALRVGMTGLATLALLSSAEEGIPGGPHRFAVEAALDHLRGSVRDDGTIGAVDGLGERDFAYTLFNHSLAVAALSESRVLAHGDDDPLLKRALARLADLARRRDLRDLEPTDATTAPWVAYAFSLARGAGIEVDFDLDAAADGAMAFAAAITGDAAAAGGIALAAQLGPAASVAALEPLFEPGAPTTGLASRPRLDQLLAQLRRGETREPTRIFFAALDIRGRDAADFARWNEAARSVFETLRRQDGSYEGEYVFDAISEGGGDLYATSLAVLTLGVDRR